MNVADLIAFEEDIAREFNAGNIRAPVHLESGNEQNLIDAFQDVQRGDWLCLGWRSHLKCLLHGVPPAQLKAHIMTGRSISLCFPAHRIVSSAMVGGILPIALGIAHAIKSSGGKERVHCWLGDMTALTGTFAECARYGANWELPIRWIIEDNGASVCTDTAAVWGPIGQAIIHTYKYKSKYPHAGAGSRVQF